MTKDVEKFIDSFGKELAKDYELRAIESMLQWNLIHQDHPEMDQLEKEEDEIIQKLEAFRTEYDDYRECDESRSLLSQRDAIQDKIGAIAREWRKKNPNWRDRIVPPQPQ